MQQTATGQQAMSPQKFQRKAMAVPYLIDSMGRVWILMVQDSQTGDWTFPGGSCKKQETHAACALRELQEETCLLGPRVWSSTELSAAASFEFKTYPCTPCTYHGNAEGGSSSRRVAYRVYVFRIPDHAVPPVLPTHDEVLVIADVANPAKGVKWPGERRECMETRAVALVPERVLEHLASSAPGLQEKRSSPKSRSPESSSPESGIPESGIPERGSPESGSPENPRMHLWDFLVYEHIGSKVINFIRERSASPSNHRSWRAIKEAAALPWRAHPVFLKCVAS